MEPGTTRLQGSIATWLLGPSMLMLDPASHLKSEQLFDRQRATLAVQVRCKLPSLSSRQSDVSRRCVRTHAVKCAQSARMSKSICHRQRRSDGIATGSWIGRQGNRNDSVLCAPVTSPSITDSIVAMHVRIRTGKVMASLNRRVVGCAVFRICRQGKHHPLWERRKHQAQAAENRTNFVAVYI